MTYSTANSTRQHCLSKYGLCAGLRHGHVRRRSSSSRSRKADDTSSADSDGKVHWAAQLVSPKPLTHSLCKDTCQKGTTDKSAYTLVGAIPAQDWSQPIVH